MSALLLLVALWVAPPAHASLVAAGVHAPPVVAAAPAALASDAAGFDDAVARYEAGDYAAAASAFGALAADETDRVRRAQLHANAGTAAARADALGLALWHLESARTGAPRDPRVERNLGLVRAWLADGDAAPDRLPEPWSASVLLLAPHERGLLAAGLLTLALLALALWRAGRLRGGALVTAALLALLAAGLLLAARHAEHARAARGILLTHADVHGEPDAAREPLFRLAEGSAVRLREARAGFRLVETAEGGKGWVQAAAVRAVDVGG